MITLPASDPVSELEGCLSVPGIVAEVPRPSRAIVDALDEHGEPVRVEAEGFLARGLQHEVDHLDGVLFFDHLDPTERRRVEDLMREAEWSCEPLPRILPSPHTIGLWGR